MKDATKCKMAMHTDDNTCTTTSAYVQKGKNVLKTLSFLGKIHDMTVYSP